MGNPIVSIILPNRNYADFIADAIYSVKAQTLTDWECIIIDDASTDDSLAVISDLIAFDDRFKLVVNNSSIGISATRNIGLDMARGEYVAFLDSDDCYTEYFLEMLVDLARTTNTDVVGAPAKMVDSEFHFKTTDTKWNNDDYVVYDNAREIRNAPRDRKWIWIWRRIYKRDLFKNIRFHDEMTVNGDDLMFMLDLIWHIPRIVETNIVGVYHRLHPLSITSPYQDFNMKRVGMFPILFKYMREHLLDKYDDGFFHDLYTELFVYMLSECLCKYNATQLTDQNKKDLRNLMAESCRLIVKKYIPIKQRLLRRYLIWIQ